MLSFSFVSTDKIFTLFKMIESFAMEVLYKRYLVPLKNRNRIRINFFKGLFLGYYNFSKGLFFSYFKGKRSPHERTGLD